LISLAVRVESASEKSGFKLFGEIAAGDALGATLEFKAPGS